MSEVQSRPARGRSAARGGRGGFGSRGPRKQTNGDALSSSVDHTAESGELAELKKRYQSQLSTLKDVFPDWTDADLVLAIEDSNGDLERTIDKISEGAVSQFAEVPKKAKDRSRSKAKENIVPTITTTDTRNIRGDGARRGGDATRGGRGRGTDRGRGGFGGARGGRPAATGPRAGTSIPTTESPAWDTNMGATAEQPAQPVDAPIEAPTAPKSAATSAPAKKTWASMFAPKPAPAIPKTQLRTTNASEEIAPSTHDSHPLDTGLDSIAHGEGLPAPPPVADEIAEELPNAIDDITSSAAEKPDDSINPELILTPSHDELTKENVEHLPDASIPPRTETAFSTVASSKDIGSAIATPLSSTTQPPLARPAAGGYATTALKATAGGPSRSASFQRRLLEQQEAVVMPGNHAVDRAAVQFGSLGLGSGPDLDVDEDREDAETREQPPQHSPVTQPRASLPPAPRQGAPSAEGQLQETVPQVKQAPGLPPVPQQQQASQQSPSNPLAAHPLQSQGSQSGQRYDQFGRYGQSNVHSEASAPPQKQYDPFGQQIPPQSNQYDYSGQQSQAQSQPSAFSSANDNFSSQYLTSEQRYQNYYGSYGQQSAQSQQEAGSAQQRTGSGFGSGPNDSTFSQNQQQQQQSQARYNDAQNSGHNTPNPTLGGQQQGGPGSQGQHMQQQHGQQGHTGGYPYNHPYYGSPYYANYMNQFGGYGQGGGYGSFGKGMYGQPHHYGMSPQASYDQHSSSPANAGGFGASSTHDRAGGLGEYGRSASGTSQSHTATAGAGGFGGFQDSFGRQQGYSNQSSYGQQQGAQSGGNEDSLKPFGESKSSGPSPSALGAQQGRPGSATQNHPSQSGQSNQPQQSHQQGFGGYPSHLGNNQYGSGLGGLGHQGSGSHQQSSGYGNYGGFSGGYGGSYNNRGGWGGNYGQH